MLTHDTRYEVGQILDEAGIDHSDPDFFKKQVMVGGIQVYSPNMVMNTGSAESVLVTIGNRNIKVAVTQE